MSAVGRHWRVYRDTLLTAALIVLMAYDLGTHPQSWNVLAIGGGGLAAVSTGLRRRLPLTAFILVWAGFFALFSSTDALDWSMAFLFGFPLALFSVGAYTRGTQGYLAIAAICVGAVLLIVVSDEPFRASDIVFVVVFVGVPWGFGFAVRLHQERTAADAARTAQLLEEETRKRAAAVQAERVSIARDLHDVVSHAMAITLMQARGGRRIQDSDPHAASEAFEAIEHTNTAALGDMRRMLNVLRAGDEEPTLAPTPTLRQLPELVDQVASQRTTVDLVTDGDIDRVPPGVDLTAYRIIQEALTNVVKHAGPARITVVVRCEDAQLEIVVADDGVGTDAGEGYGLRGIRERVQAMGGSVHLGTRSPTGFVVRACLPYRPPS